ncbi:hypothetical protein BDQ17DRAFT_1062943 [Cyathus striatus]|nr:hypothetical protein BDQ17DRAFT_1062943 [Cyathus striatus]
MIFRCGSSALLLNPMDISRKIAQATSIQNASGPVPIPESSTAKPKKAKRISKLTQDFHTATGHLDEAGLAKLAASFQEWAATVPSRESKSTRDHRERIEADWEAFLQIFYPQVTEESVWTFDVVKQGAIEFLRFKVVATSPLPGKSVLKARTLEGWFHSFVTSIAKNTRDPVSKELRGMVLLAHDGLYHKLKDAVIYLIQERALDRKLNPKQYFGRSHLQAMFSYMLKSSKVNGRVAVLQQIFRILCSFYMTSRPSTLGVPEAKWRELGYYPKLRDVRIFRLGLYLYKIEVHWEHFKGKRNTATADEQVFILDSVKLGHNLLFDPTLYLVLFLFCRKAFGEKYPTLDALLSDDSAELSIDESKLDDPLFLELKFGGKEFVTPEAPATAASASHTFGDWAQKAGLPRAGMSAIRRDAGNNYGLQLSFEIAQDLMNHAPSDSHSVYRKSYSRNTANYAVVGIRLGEEAGPGEAYPGQVLHRQESRMDLKDPVIDALLYQLSSTKLEEDKAAKEARMEAINKDPEMISLLAECDEVSDKYESCFSKGTAAYERNLANVHLMYEIGSGNKKQGTEKKRAYGDLFFLSGRKEEALQIMHQLEKIYKRMRSLHQRLERKMHQEEFRQRTLTLQNKSVAGTTTERAAALLQSRALAPEVIDALKRGALS